MIGNKASFFSAHAATKNIPNPENSAYSAFTSA